MKKNKLPKHTLITTFMMAGFISSSANSAVTIYEKGPLKYEIKADFQIQLDKDVGDNRDLDVEFDDLEFKNIITYDVGNNISAFAEVHFGFDNAGNRENRDDATRFEEGFIGLDFGAHRILIGQTNSAGDEFGVEKAYEKVGVPEDGFEETRDRGDDLIRYDGNFGPVTIASSYEFESEGDRQSHFDIFGSFDLAGFNIAAAFMQYQPNENADDIDVAGLSVSYDAGFMDFGVDFSTIDNANDEVEIYNVVAGFNVGLTGYVGLGVNNVDQGSDLGDTSGWYANYTYKFPKATNVRLLAEVGGNDADDTDIGYVLGIRVLL